MKCSGGLTISKAHAFAGVGQAELSIRADVSGGREADSGQRRVSCPDVSEGSETDSGQRRVSCSQKWVGIFCLLVFISYLLFSGSLNFKPVCTGLFLTTLYIRWQP